MLSDHEQQTLRALEAQLTGEDATFAHSFAAHQQRLGNNRRRLTDKAVHVGVAVLAIAALIAGFPAAALQLVVATELAWWMWQIPALE